MVSRQRCENGRGWSNHCSICRNGFCARQNAVRALLDARLRAARHMAGMMLRAAIASRVTGRTEQADRATRSGYHHQHDGCQNCDYRTHHGTGMDARNAKHPRKIISARIVWIATQKINDLRGYHAFIGEAGIDWQMHGQCMQKTLTPGVRSDTCSQKSRPRNSGGIARSKVSGVK